MNFSIKKDVISGNGANRTVDRAAGSAVLFI